MLPFLFYPKVVLLFKNLFKKYKAAFEGLPFVVVLLSIVAFVNRSGSMVLGFFTLYLTKSHGFTLIEAGQLISLYGIGALLGTILGGYLCDKIGPYVIQISSLFLSGIGFILLERMETRLEIGVTLFCLALVTEAFRPANAAAIAHSCPPDKVARSFALNRFAINLGMAIGPAVGGILAQLNYSYLFWVDGGTCILSGFLFLSLLSKFPNPKPALSGTKLNPKSVKKPWKDSTYLFTISLLFLLGVLFAQVMNTWPVYLKEFYHLGEREIGALMALNALFIVLVEMPLVHRLERYPPLKVMAIGSLFLCGGFALLPLGKSWLFVAFTVLIWTLGEAITFSVSTGFVATLSPEESRGQYMGFFNFTFALAHVIAPLAGTWIYEKWGPSKLWYSFIVIGILIFCGFRGLHSHLDSQKS